MPHIDLPDPNRTATSVPKRRPSPRIGLAAALLFAAVTVLHHDVLFLGRSVVTSNFYNPIDPRRTTDNYGPGMVPLTEWSDRNLVPYPNLRDPGATWWQWEPAIRFLQRSWDDREWPFWDPYIGAGTPAMANLLPAFFFPPSLIVVALGATPVLLNAYFLLLLWAASVLTFAFLSDHHLDFVSALTGATAVLVGGTLVQHLGTFIGQTAACMALTMWGTRRWLDAPTRGRTAALALCYATTALASFPPVLVAIFGITAAYAIIGAFEYPAPRRLRLFGGWAGGAALALGLVAFYYVPALAAKASSSQVSDLYSHAGLQTISVLHLYQLLSPTLMGGLPTYAVRPVNIGVPFVPFVGSVTLGLAFLAGAGAGDCRRRTLLVTSFVCAAAVLLKLVGAPGVQLMGTLPLLREIHIAHYFGIPLGFLIAYLTALGLQRLGDGAVTIARAGLAAGVLVLLVEGVWWNGTARGAFETAAADYWLRDWWVLALVALTAAVVVCLGALWGPRVRTAASLTLLLLLAAENGYNGWYPNPAAWDVFANPPAYVKVLEEIEDRAFTFGALSANLNSAFGIPVLDSLMAFNPSRVYALYHRYTNAPREVFMREAKQIPPEPVLDRANIGVFVVSSFAPGVKEAAESRGYSRVFDDGLFTVFRRPTSPRFRFVSNYRIVSTADAVEAVAEEDPRIVILEQDPGVAATAGRPDDPTVRVESQRHNSLTLIVDAPRAGLVYAADSFAEGWTARVNGAEVPILPANYAFRAVAVEPGSNRIEMRYWPPGLTAGLSATAASAAALIALTLPIRRRRDLQVPR